MKRFNSLTRMVSCVTRSLLTSMLLILFAMQSQAKEENLIIGHFSEGGLQGWQEKEFLGTTHYTLVDTQPLSHQGQVLMAHSDHSASGLFKTQRIDLQKTPILHWSWQTGSLYSGLNEQTKQGDDFVARIYIVIDGGMFFWKTQAVNYVWSSSHKKETFWPNPHTKNATMFVVETGEDNLDQWVSYQRNVASDLKMILGESVRYIDAIAVMTDSDNAGQQAVTYYGDIYFSAE